MKIDLPYLAKSGNDRVAARAAIFRTLDEFLDWTGPPWNMAVNEACRDYDRLTDALMKALGFDGITGY
jgi:hypothetical protein